jgi:beta-lactamase superfamily II metal-dependent hydrolase
VDVLTLYVGQGALAGIRMGNEGIIVDAHLPENEHVTPEEIQQTLSLYFRNVAVRGLILTGFDGDHAHAGGVEWILSQFTPDWIMYPKYFKDTDCADEVFRSISKHEKSRALSSRPLVRHSIRLDKLDSRQIAALGRDFSIEVFSPHFEDMDSSNNCSIVAKITGHDASGFRYLATGDTENARWETINRLFGSTLASDVMAASHHGARSGAHPRAVQNINPNTILISAGIDSQYDHPHGVVIQVYQNLADHLWATNAGGNAYNLLTRRNGSDFTTTVFPHAVVAA